MSPRLVTGDIMTAGRRGREAASPQGRGSTYAARGAGWDDDAMSGTPRFLTLADVAEVLNTSSAQVYALVRRGDLPAIKIGGRGQWRVEREQLEELHRADVRRDPRRSSTSTRSSSPTARRSTRTIGPDDALGQPTSASRVISTTCSSPSRHEGELDGLAGPVGPDRDDQRDPVDDPLAVDLGDDVALLRGRCRTRGCRAAPRRSARRCRHPSPPVCTFAPITG